MAEKQDVYTTITNKVIADLERGDLTWLKPWQTNIPPQPLRSTGEPYHGVNVLMLWFAAMERGFASPYWMTYKQAEELGAHVRKGEKGSHVVYTNTFTKTETNDSGEEVEKQIPFLKTYSVFNTEQIDGLPERYYVKVELPADKERVARAEQFFGSLGVTLRHGGQRAYYDSTFDAVQMPDFVRFHDSLSYYATLAHEVMHWTGHASRLNREFGQRFGDEAYAIEELVAELGAAFLCADLNLVPEPRIDTAAYVGAWLKVLKHDRHAVFNAASKAQKALDFIHQLHERAPPLPEETLIQVAKDEDLTQGLLELQ